MIDLNNNLTLRFLRMTHDLFLGFVGFDFQLFPTGGTIAGVQSDEYRMFVVQGNKEDPFSSSLYTLTVGKSVSELKTFLLSQWQLYQTSPDDIEEPLRELLEYVDSVGIV